MVLEKINLIPHELVKYIKDYLTYNTLKCSNKNNFNLYFDKKINTNLQSTYKKWNTTYLNNIIKSDSYFVFNILLKNNFLILKKKHCGVYKTQSFSTYLELFDFFCIKYNSQRCRKVLHYILNENGYRKKRVKKIRLKHNRWSN
jgi:hypothetical protein